MAAEFSAEIGDGGARGTLENTIGLDGEDRTNEKFGD
jgi:hypothetical protein